MLQLPEMAPNPHEQNQGEEQNASMTLARRVLLWLLFFVICLGLGYSPLNRYDPAKIAGTSDVAVYREIVIGEQLHNAAEAGGPIVRFAQWENYYRVLVPYAAKPFYWLAKGRVGSWDPALLGLLIANALFTATTASLLVAVGRRLGFNSSDSFTGRRLVSAEFCCLQPQSRWTDRFRRRLFYDGGGLVAAHGALVSAAALGRSGRTRQGDLCATFQLVRNRVVVSHGTTEPPAVLPPPRGLRIGSFKPFHGNHRHVNRRGWLGMALGVCQVHARRFRVLCRVARVHSRPRFLVCFYLVAPARNPALAPSSLALGTGLRGGVLWSLGAGSIQQCSRQYRPRPFQRGRTDLESFHGDLSGGAGFGE